MLAIAYRARGAPLGYSKTRGHGPEGSLTRRGRPQGGAACGGGVETQNLQDQRGM